MSRLNGQMFVKGVPVTLQVIGVWHCFEALRCVALLWAVGYFESWEMVGERTGLCFGCTVE